MSINLSVPEQNVERELKPKITVVGVGGAGGNAVNDMINSQLEGVEFLVVNTDAQSLKCSDAERRVQMGVNVTNGLGAGASPEIGHAAAEESLSEIMEHLDGANMVFIAAGMGGGTGTGGAPVIAKACRDKGILTVGVVTKPFHFEGHHRMKLAEQGIEELGKHVDTLIVIPNQNLFRVANEKTTFADAFRMADEVLYSGVRGVTDLIIMPGMINLDFADIRSVMHEMGKAMMGTGEAEGERRALDAAEAAIANPLLDDSSMKGAKGVLINITGGSDMTLFEVDEAANRIRSEVDEDAYIIFGSAFEENLEGKIRVSVVATGIDSDRAVRSIPTVPSVSSSSTKIEDAPEVLRVEDTVENTVVDTPEEIVAEAVEVVDEPVKSAEPKDAEQTPLSFSMLKKAISVSSSKPAESVEEDDAEPTLDTATESEISVTSEVETAPLSEMPVSNKANETDKVEMPEEQAPPAAMPHASSDDAFIPPAPAVASGKEVPTPSKPFAESDFVNGASEPAAVTSQPAAKKPVIKRAGSLFKTILGANKPVSAPQPLDWQSKTVEEPAVVTAAAPTVSPAPVTAPAIAQSPASVTVSNTTAGSVQGSAQGSAQTSLGVVEQVESKPLNDAEEDLLDIPAFLRRQAN